MAVVVILCFFPVCAGLFPSFIPVNNCVPLLLFFFLVNTKSRLLVWCAGFHIFQIFFGPRVHCGSLSLHGLIALTLTVFAMLLLLCCSHINSHNQVRGHRTGSSHSGVEEYPREKKKKTQRWYTHISQLTQFMPPPETYKNRESAYDVPGPYWCIRLTTRAW